MKYHQMLLKIIKFCEDQHAGSGYGCDRCPLLDQEADCCYLHANMPFEWGIEKIKEVLNGEHIQE